MLRRRSPDWLIGLLCWLPLVLTNPGTVSADTKTYLALDPSRVLSEAGTLWNPDIGLGTVTHQYVGYLWPMGPYYWVCELVGLPDWLTQRLWWGALLWVAGCGLRRLALDLGLPGVASVVAALAYCLAPYPLQYMARLSGLLIAWAAVPWMILWVRRLRHDHSWIPPVVLALIVASSGTMNASALLLVGLGPAAWLSVDVLSRRVTPRAGAIFLGRFTLLSLGLNAWWMWSLAVQGTYGLPILRYTETYETVAKASTPLELLRGLGYWFFYGGDLRARWVDASATFMQNRIVITAGFGLVAVGVAGLAGLLRRDRANMAVMMMLGLGVAVGSAPLGDSSPFGRAFLHLVQNEAGFALRSTPRASPLVLLGLSLGVGLAVGQLLALSHGTRQRQRVWGRAGALAIALALLAQANPHFTARYLTEGITRPESLPAYLPEAAAVLSRSAAPNTQARVYEFPGTDFASHNWGSTVDPVMAGLTTASYIARELVPYGSDGTADLLDATESRLQEAVADTADITLFARLISATAVAWRADLDYAAYRTPRPEQLGAVLAATPPGPEIYRSHESVSEDLPRITDAQTYAMPGVSDPPAYQAWGIDTPRPNTDAAPLDDLVVVSGDGRGIMAALRAGVVSPLETILYAASVDNDGRFSGVTARHLVLTDSNRRSARRWYSVYSNLGRTERTDERPLFEDPSDNRLYPFLDDPRADSADLPQSVTRLVGDVESIRSLLGDAQAYHTPEDRPEHAFDGDLRTSWRGAALAPATGHGVEVVLRRPVTVPHVNLALPTEGLTSRRVKDGRIVMRLGSGGPARTVSFRLGFGNEHKVELDGQPFDRFRLIIDSDNLGERTSWDDVPALGFAEIALPGITNREWVVLASPSRRADRVSVVLERWRTEQSTTNRSDPEIDLARVIPMARPAVLTLQGMASINAFADDSVVSEVFGLRDAATQARLPATWRSSGGFALDGNATTAWTTDFDPAGKAALQASIETPPGPNRSLRVMADPSPRYSTPRIITLTDSESRNWRVRVSPRDGAFVGAIPDALVSPIVSVRLDAVNEVRAPEYFTGVERVLPVRVTEIETDSPNTAVPRFLDPTCRTDLLVLNGRPVPIRLTPTAATASLGTFGVEACEKVDLRAGENLLLSSPGRDTGIDIDSVVMTEEGSASEAVALTTLGASDTSRSMETDLDVPHVVSFSQSINKGWRATFDDGGSTRDLGRPFVVQGYANGWVVPGAGTVSLEWTPQATATRTQLLSLAASVVVLTMLVISFARRRSRRISLGEHSAESAGDHSPRWASLTVVAAAGIFGGLVPGLGAVLALGVPRRLLAAVASAGLAIIGAVVVWTQGRMGYQATLDWPGHFRHLVTPTWVCVVWALMALCSRNGRAKSQ